MYAVVDSNQVVIDVIETGPATAPEGGFIAQTSVYKKGDYYGGGGFPAFSEIDGPEVPVAPVIAPVENTVVPEEAPVVPATGEDQNG